MSGKRFDPERLSQLLAPCQFTINSPEFVKGRLSFVRRSSFERLYEHLLITTTNPAYVETVMSGASFRSCHDCVSEIDTRFRSFMATDARYQKSDVSTAVKAVAWQKRLVENADTFCKSMAKEKGPALAKRLAAVFKLVELYVIALGEISSVLDREYSFVTEIPRADQIEADRLASQARSMLYLNSEDAKLASVTLVRYGPIIEGEDSAFRGKKPYQNTTLAARIILLTDYIRVKRFDYDTDRGLYR
jgi:hypothetical protein